MTVQQPQPQPWFEPCRHHNPDKTATVIGGGIAGTSTAWSLARRGWQVTLIEQHRALASEASGNPQGILYAKLSADNTPLSQFILKGYHYTLSLLKTMNLPEHEWQSCGVIQLAIDEKTRQRYQRLNQQHPDTLLEYLNKDQLSDIAGLPLENSGLFFPNSGWVHPPALCRVLANHPGIQVLTENSVDALKKHDNGWQIKSGDKTLADSKTVVIAQGTTSRSLPALQHIPLKSIRGQITQVKSTEKSRRLTSCVCGEGYIAPSVNRGGVEGTGGFHTTGATFNFGDNSPVVTHRDHQQNLDMQARWFPAMYQAMGAEQAEITGGRVGFRCTTPDYLPVVGNVVDCERFIERYSPLRKNRKHRFQEAPDYLDGLFINTGHGSRGLITCPLSSEILADRITGQSEAPIPDRLLNAIHPSRFLVRDLVRNKI